MKTKMKKWKAGENFLYPKLSYLLLGCIYDVRNTYGNGQKELVYQNALAEKLKLAKIPFKKEVNISIKSEDTGRTLGSYKLDFVVDKKIIVEAKALKFTPSKIQQQLYSYLKSTPYKLGYLVNFGSTKLYFKRVILTKKSIR